MASPPGVRTLSLSLRSAQDTPGSNRHSPVQSTTECACRRSARGRGTPVARCLPIPRSRRPRCPVGGVHDADALGPKDLVERSGELGVSIPEQDVPVLQLLRDRQVPNLLSDPGGVGPARRSDDVDSPRGDLDEETRRERLQEHRFDCEDVAGQDPPARARRNSVQAGPVRCVPRPRPARRGTRRTVLAPTRMPSLRSSPWRMSVATC